MTQSHRGVFITGTDTDVGKTWVGSAIIRGLRSQGVKVKPRKPIESGWPSHSISESDAWKLAEAANCTEELDQVCPNRFIEPISPVRAAQLEGIRLSVATVAQQSLEGMADDEFCYVEGAGGFYSPLCSDGLNADLAEQLAMPVVLVAEDKLGVINQVLLTIEAIERKQLPILALVLNQANNSHDHSQAMNNLADLQKLTDLAIYTYRYQQKEVAAELLQKIQEQ